MNAIREDTRRFIRDRDHALRVEQLRTTDEMSARGLLYSGIHESAQATLKMQALHEYRDEITAKLRRYREIREAEWLVHRLARRGSELGRFELSDESKAILAGWREDVVNDPTGEDLEPGIRRFEADGEPPQTP